MTTTGKRRMLLLGSLQKFEAAYAGQFEIGKDKMNGLGCEQLQTGFRVSGGERLEAVFAEVQLKQAPHLGFVFDDENGWHARCRLFARCSSFAIRCSLCFLILYVAFHPRGELLHGFGLGCFFQRKEERKYWLRPLAHFPHGLSHDGRR